MQLGFIKNHGELFFIFRAFNVIVCIMVNLNILPVLKNLGYLLFKWQGADTKREGSISVLIGRCDGSWFIIVLVIYCYINISL